MTPKQKPSLAKRLATAEALLATAGKQIEISNAAAEEFRYISNRANAQLMFAYRACELNMSAYEDALAHSKVNHQLLTEARAEIEKLKTIKSLYFRIPLQEIGSALGVRWGSSIGDNILPKVKELCDENARLRQTNKVYVKANGELQQQVLDLDVDVKLQRELLINYNTRGNLIHWFGEFLLSKERP